MGVCGCCGGPTSCPLHPGVTRAEEGLFSEWACLRPADRDIERWDAVGRLLRSLPDEKFTPWEDYADIVTWLGRIRPSALLDCPDPVLSADVQVGCEAIGDPIPSWVWGRHTGTDIDGVSKETFEITFLKE
jgi:hypothetical protein